MKAITIWQPYANLILAGLKRYETRTWSTNYRGKLVIHAGSGGGARERKVIEMIRAQLPEHAAVVSALKNGVALGTVELVAVHPCTALIVSPLEREVGNWDSKFAWELADPVWFEQPIATRGFQGLWDWGRAILPTI
jgi:hypothetical protein